MSVINKMLQDLDRRNAMAGIEAQSAAQNVKAMDPGQKGSRDWFWRVVSALLLVAVGWVGWVVYQLLPRPLVTEQVFRMMENKAVASAPAKAPEVPPPAAQAAPPAPPAPAPVEPKPAAEPAQPKLVAPADTFKLARAIETPIAERRAPPAKPKAAAPKAAPPPAAAPKPAATQAVKAAAEPRAISKTASNSADTQFRRAAQFLNQGRVSEAEAQLAIALKSEPAHAQARQAYVALLLEQGRVEEAREMLQEAVATNPSHAPFALALARIHVERRDYPAALQAMDKAGAAAQGSDFQSLRAVVLQRMGRHDEAVSAYQAALRSGPQQATTWMGLGISLEALGHRPEAAQAYKRALGAGALAAEVRDYAEARLRALD
jgi:MSHA biogenesis protein MshN